MEYATAVAHRPDSKASEFCYGHGHAVSLQKVPDNAPTII
jgi:hypothetical protein